MCADVYRRLSLSLDEYLFFGGCEKGTSCLEGLICGRNEDKACGSCSFDECRNHAIAQNSYAFSYRGTSDRWCRFCNKKAFENRIYKTDINGLNPDDWGIYVQPTLSKYIRIVYNIKVIKLNCIT